MDFIENDKVEYSRTAYPALVEADGMPYLARCPSEHHDHGWQDAVVDVTDQEQGDYAFILRCGHTYVGFVEEPCDGCGQTGQWNCRCV